MQTLFCLTFDQVLEYPETDECQFCSDDYTDYKKLGWIFNLEEDKIVIDFSQMILIKL